MANYLAITLIVVLCFSMVLNNPISEPEEQQEAIIRQKRVTCDLFSAQGWGFALNDAPCAAHCLVLGKKGGHCEDGICVCRN